MRRRSSWCSINAGAINTEYVSPRINEATQDAVNWTAKAQEEKKGSTSDLFLDSTFIVRYICICVWVNHVFIYASECGISTFWVLNPDVGRSLSVVWLQGWIWHPNRGPDKMRFFCTRSCAVLIANVNLSAYSSQSRCPTSVTYNLIDLVRVWIILSAVPLAWVGKPLSLVEVDLQYC